VLTILTFAESVCVQAPCEPALATALDYGAHAGRSVPQS
jgi:hypothetical protein